GEGMEEEQNADLPRPRKKDFNLNINSESEYIPDPDILYEPDDEEDDNNKAESGDVLPVPELRRTQTRKFSVSEPASEFYKSQDNSGYEANKAHKAHALPERQTHEGRTSGRTVKNHKNNNNSKNSKNPKNVKKTTEPRKSSAPKSRKKSHGGGILKRLIRKILVLAMILFGIYSAVALLLISKLEKMPRMLRTVTTGTLDAGYVQNILLIGTDARDITTERGRSDTILLLSMNSMTEKLYLTSFMRDAYVQIPGYGNNKLNAAYAYGGAELLMDTLEQNYQISIDDYFCVSFMGFAGVIDAFGGVEIDVSDAEAQAVNEILQSEVNALAGDDIMSDFLEKGGKFVLNGKQALSYARIRYVGNADFERTSRQREVMTQIFQNMKSKAATAVPELVSSALPHVGANMSTMDLYFLSLKAPLVVSYDIEQLQIPANGTYTPADIDGQSVLQVDFNANTQILKDTVYSLPEPTEQTGVEC
ncbi:MAG: LCP family protein, partial [Oscillospiraceae bacterium]|nr:LCP family protein [Oscillospiraceae bacterium]